MKEDFQEGRDKLICHLEQRLNQLKNKRKQIRNNSQTKQLFTHHFREVIQDPTNYIDNTDKLNELQQIYELKKQLQRLGIYQSDPNKILQYSKQPFIKEKLQLNQPSNYFINSKKTEIAKFKQKKRLQLDQEKKKIIDQQLLQVKKLLRKKKLKKYTQQTTHSFQASQVIQDKQQYQIYKRLLKKNNNTLLQKQQLMKIVFDSLKQYPQKVHKFKVSQFLFSNPIFTQKFNITDQQILRDLQVYETIEKNYLNFREFYEFIKSIQLTNQILKPNMHKKTILKNKNSNKQITKLQEDDKNLRDQEKNLQKYIKKLFGYIDKNRQSVIERDIFKNFIKKRLFLKEIRTIQTSKKQRKQQPYKVQKYHLDKEPKTIILKTSLDNFLKYFQEYNLHCCSSKNYYKQNQSKYMGFQEVMSILKAYFKTQSQQQKGQTASNQINQSQIGNKQTKQESMSENKNVKNILSFLQAAQPNINELKIQQQNLSLQNNCINKQRQNTQNVGKQKWQKYLPMVDKYYKQLNKKYANEIQWQALDLGLPSKIKIEDRQILKQFKKFEEQFKKYDNQTLHK